MKKIISVEYYEEPIANQEIDEESCLELSTILKDNGDIFIRMGCEQVRTNSEDYLWYLKEQIKFIKNNS